MAPAAAATTTSAQGSRQQAAVSAVTSDPGSAGRAAATRPATSAAGTATTAGDHETIGQGPRLPPDIRGATTPAPGIEVADVQDAAAVATATATVPSAGLPAGSFADVDDEDLT
jgi:hypothetical protein